MKANTDLEQSKQLAEILPLKSADMWWLYVTAQGKRIAMMHEEPDPHYLARMGSYGIKDAAIPCWSLAALIATFPCSKESPTFSLTRGGWNPSFTRDWFATWEGEDTVISVSADNPVDAVVKLIIQIHQTTDKNEL